MQEYVAGLMYCNGNVALIQKQRPDWQKGKFNGIGGHIEKNELPEEAMVREFYEETLFKSSKIDWSKFCILSGDNWKVHWFRSEIGKDQMYDVKTNTDEFVCWFPLAYLPYFRIGNIDWLIQMSNLKCKKDWVYHIVEKGYK